VGCGERDHEGGSCCGMMEVVNDGGDREEVDERGKEVGSKKDVGGHQGMP